MHVLVTRPEHLADGFCEKIKERGWTAVRFPCLAIESLKASSLADYGLLIFTSPNSVQCADISTIKSGQKIIAMGPGTQAALMMLGVDADTPCAPYTSEELLKMPAIKSIVGRKIAVVSGVGGRDLIAPELSARGAIVDKLEVYRRIQANPDRSVLSEFWSAPKRAIIITSQEALINLIALVPKKDHVQLFASQLVVPSQRIKDSVQAQRFNRVIISKSVRNEDFIAVLSLG